VSLMNGAGGGGRVAGVGIGEEGMREANVGVVRRISGMNDDGKLQLSVKGSRR